MTRIMLVEDEASLSEPLAFLLQREGYEVDVVEDGPAAVASFDKDGADLILLDLMLPGLPGTELCREIRTRSAVPIIMLTAKDSEVDIVVGLERGADDYVTKPYSTRELLARIRAVLRRRVEVDDEPLNVLEVGSVRMDVERHTVEVDGREIAMPLKEFELSSCCCATRGACSRAASSSTGCGDPTTSATPRPSTCTSSGSAPRSSASRPTPCSSSPSAGWATASRPRPPTGRHDEKAPPREGRGLRRARPRARAAG